MRKSFEPVIRIGNKLLNQWEKAIEDERLYATRDDHYEFENLVKLVLSNEFGEDNPYQKKFDAIEDEVEVNRNDKLWIFKEGYEVMKKKLNLLETLQYF